MTAVLLKGREKGQTEEERSPFKGRGRGWSDAAASQGCQGMGSTAWSQEEATVDSAQLPVVLRHPVCDPLL